MRVGSAGFPRQPLATVELLIAVILFIVGAYVKVAWWSDPVMVALGIATALGLVAVSFLVLRPCATV